MAWAEDIASRHLAICQAFGEEVNAVGAAWRSQSPCTDWDARGVLEHVIGIHDVLILKPLGAKPRRPSDDPVGRWTATCAALEELLTRSGPIEVGVHVPAVGTMPASRIDAARLLPMLSLDVLVHTWDLSRAAGHRVHLDPVLCRTFLEELPSDGKALSGTGLYDSPFPVTVGSDAQTTLLARLGRDPEWRASSRDRPAGTAPPLHGAAGR